MAGILWNFVLAHDGIEKDDKGEPVVGEPDDDASDPTPAPAGQGRLEGEARRRRVLADFLTACGQN